MGDFLRRYEQNAWTVSYFVESLGNTLKSFGDFLVCGEISECKLSSHLYFKIKDEKAVLECVMFRSYLSRVDFEPTIGQTVLVSGKGSLYAKNGKFSLAVEHMELTGVGQIMARIAMLERQLRREGVIPRRPLPRPRVFSKVLVVTSPSGVVRFDISTNVRMRNPMVQLTFIDTKVQGDDAPPYIVDSLNRAYRIAMDYGFDAVILARGGGSVEDLACFSSEPVVRTVACSPVYIISAIGHDSDHPLCELAADVAVSTPTAAAAFITPITIDDFMRRLDNAERALDNQIYRCLDELKDKINYLSDKISSERNFDFLQGKIELQKSSIDRQVSIMDRLVDQKLAFTNNLISRYEAALDKIPDRLLPFEERLRVVFSKLDFSLDRDDPLPRNFDDMTKHARERIEALSGRLDHIFAKHADVPLQSFEERLRVAFSKLDFSLDRDDPLPRNFDEMTQHAGERIEDLSNKLEQLFNEKVATPYSQYVAKLNKLITKLNLINPISHLQKGLTYTTLDGFSVIDENALTVDQEIVTLTKNHKIYSKITKVEDFNPLEVLDTNLSADDLSEFDEMVKDV